MTKAVAVPVVFGHTAHTGCRPGPSSQTHTLSGRVVEGTTQGVRPMADAPIMITIFPPPGAFPRSGFRSVVSDSEGRYVIGEVPHQHSVVLKAASPYTPGRLQPCAAALTMGADAVLATSSRLLPDDPQDDPRLSNHLRRGL